MTIGMNLYKDARYGTYYIRFSREECPPNGKALSLRKLAGYAVKDRDDAKAIFNAYKDDKLKEKLIRLQFGDQITIQELSDKFAETDKERQDLSPKTLRMDKLALKMLASVIGPKKQIKAISRADLIKFKDAYLKKKKSPETIKTYFRHIRSALNYAISYGYLDRLPKFPKVKTEKKLPKIIPANLLDIIMAQLKKTKPDAWRYAEFSLWTGCRLTEILGVKWQHITLFDEPAGVVHGLALVTGKGDKERSVPLLAEALAVMGKQKDIGPVFVQRHPDTISHWFHDAVVDCGLSKTKYHFHSLRHTAATRMLGKGYRIETVQKILGHVDIRTTQEYAKLFDKEMIDEINKFA